MWIETKDKMPEPGIPVLVYVQNVYGDKTRRLRAQYADKHMLEMEVVISDCEDDVDYSEAEDTYYVKPGWYETNENEETHWRIIGDVTHWMPLPEPPK